MINLKKLWRLILAGILISGTLVLLACSSGGQTLKIGEPVPDFKLQDYKGQTFRLSDYRGKSVLIHFWDTTFDPCTKELPYLQELNDEWVKSGNAVLLTIDATEGVSSISSFMQNYNYTFVVLLDSDAKIAGKYNVTLVPSSIFIDKDGKMQLKVAGPFKDKAAIDKQLAAFLQ